MPSERAFASAVLAANCLKVVVLSDWHSLNGHHLQVPVNTGIWLYANEVLDALRNTESGKDEQ